MLKKLKEEENQSAQSCFAFVQEKREETKNINQKLQKLLDTYLDQDIERETYLDKKAKLWGNAAKYPGQEVSLSTPVAEDMQIRFI